MPDETGNNPTQQSLQTTLAEHHGCMHAVADLEDALGRPSDPSAPWLSFLLPKLGSLRASLAEHFALENDSALYREIPLKKPQVADQIDRLAEEHDVMLNALDALRRLGEKSRAPDAVQIRELKGRAQVLVSLIRRHEAEENEILMNAYWNEIGVGD